MANCQIFIMKYIVLMADRSSDFVTNFFNEFLGLIWEKVVGPRPNSMSRQSESKKHNFLCPSKVLNTFLGSIPKIFLFTRFINMMWHVLRASLRTHFDEKYGFFWHFYA